MKIYALALALAFAAPLAAVAATPAQTHNFNQAVEQTPHAPAASISNDIFYGTYGVGG